MKECTICHEVKLFSDFYKIRSNKEALKPLCKVCCKKQVVEWKSHLKNVFGITVEEYNSKLNDQMGVCAICYRSSTKALAVDHNHQTGQIRGLLCSECNSAIGLLKENREVLGNAIEYLENYEFREYPTRTEVNS